VSPQTSWRLGRRPALDGLRGLAIVLVIACHLIDTVTGVDHPALGTAGVTVFFTLSGFLITSLLMEEHAITGRLRWGHFYGRRARRLLPALAVVLVVIGSVQVAGGFTGPMALLPVAFYVANWFAADGHNLGLLPHSWSLAIEEQFYLAWPVLLLICLRRSRRAVGVVCLAGIVIAVTLRLSLWDHGAGAQRVYFGTDTRADALLVGCALAAWAHRGRRLPDVPPLVGTIAAVGLVAVSLALSGPYGTHIVLPTVVPWLSAVLIVSACATAPAWMESAVVRYLGRRSYSLYLWHFALLLMVGNLTSSVLAAVLAVLASLGVAELSWRYVESPVLGGASPRITDPLSAGTGFAHASPVGSAE
jgi:peptidoglycan/LPS O-acetylase OafA/YrhL